MHWLADGHATPESEAVSIVAGRGVPGEVGLNVTSCPPPSTAVHWVVEGHANACSPEKKPGSIVMGVGFPGEVGLNVTS